MSNVAETQPRPEEFLKVPPHSVEAEQAILGGLMLDNTAWDTVADIVSSGDFYRRDHKLIFNALGDLAERGEPGDAVTVSEFLEKRDELDSAGGTRLSRFACSRDTQRRQRAGLRGDRA